MPPQVPGLSAAPQPVLLFGELCMRRIPTLASLIAAACLIAGCSNAGPQAASVAVPPGVNPAVLDANGYIRQWLILAPISFGDKYAAEDIEKEQIPNEANLTPKAGDKQTLATEEGEPGAYKTVQKQFTWTPVVTSDYFFDINEMLKLDASDSMGAYAVAYVDSPSEITGVTFSLCSNDNGAMYLNGKSVYTFVGGRALSEDADLVENLTLKKGVNTIIFKVWNDSNNWQGCLRLVTKDLKPIPNLKVRLSK
jgi:hypothetical protein